MRRNVKELLTAAKDASELMLDLAFAAVFFDDDELAREVIRLEENMDATVHELRILCMVAARSPEDAEQLAGVLRMASSIEEIADAAEDIARVVLRDLGVPGELRDDLRHAQEVTARVKLRPDSSLAGASLRGLALPSETGMWVIAVRHDIDYEYGPGPDTVLAEGDVLFLQGPAEGVDLVRERAGGERYRLGVPQTQGRLSNLERAVDILIELKNASEAAVGLAYSAILFRDMGLAREVSGLEDTCDELYHDLEQWVLRAAGDLEDSELGELRALLQIGSSAEAISDAAQEMTRVAERPEEPHPVVAAALSKTDEIVADALVTAQGAAAGKTLKELRLHVGTGMEVLAIQRDGRWLYRPRPGRELAEGDRLLVIGPEEGVPQLRELTGDVRDQEPALP
ncbi:MAG: DUF47 family protein [Nitriliruptorales bacterium]|nr:DUF47 family protein [Nitriliruptorales bacterium]